jgi:hypothetical protein
MSFPLDKTVELHILSYNQFTTFMNYFFCFPLFILLLLTLNFLLPLTLRLLTFRVDYYLIHSPASHLSCRLLPHTLSRKPNQPFSPTVPYNGA